MIAPAIPIGAKMYMTDVSPISMLCVTFSALPSDGIPSDGRGQRTQNDHALRLH